MKLSKLFLICSIAALAVACSDDEMFFEEDVTEVFENGGVIKEAEFVSDAHPTSGLAQVVMAEDSRTLVFSDFRSDSGPDLDVYLATDTDATEFINLGGLKGTSGQFSYEVPLDIDLEKYDKVLIWCVRFSINFGFADLERVEAGS